jgi:hypothetical protein
MDASVTLKLGGAGSAGEPDLDERAIRSVSDDPDVHCSLIKNVANVFLKSAMHRVANNVPMFIIFLDTCNGTYNFSYVLFCFVLTW